MAKGRWAKTYVDKADRTKVDGLKEGDVQVTLGDEGSGDDLIKKFRKERSDELSADDRHKAAVMCCMAVAARLQALEVDRMNNVITTPEKESEYRELRALWSQFPETMKIHLAAKIYELARMAPAVWRFYE